MDEISRWLSLSLDHLKVRWETYIGPSLVFFGIALVVTTIVMTVVTILPIFLIIPMLGAGEMSEDAAAGIAIGMTVGYFALIIAGVFAASIVFAPLQLRFLRGVLTVLRGGTFEIGDLFRGRPGDIGRSVGLMLLISLMSGIGFLLAYIPGILIGTLLVFAMPVMADRDLGAIDSIKASIELTKSRFGWILLYVFITSMIMSVISSVPLVGALAAIPIYIVMILVAYRGVIGELPQPHRAPPGYPSPGGGGYPPPQGGGYPPPQGSGYPPPQGGGYPPPQGGAPYGR